MYSATVEAPEGVYEAHAYQGIGDLGWMTVDVYLNGFLHAQGQWQGSAIAEAPDVPEDILDELARGLEEDGI